MTSIERPWRRIIAWATVRAPATAAAIQPSAGAAAIHAAALATAMARKECADAYKPIFGRACCS